jgi:hypothetical protein
MLAAAIIFSLRRNRIQLARDAPDLSDQDA